MKYDSLITVHVWYDVPPTVPRDAALHDETMQTALIDAIRLHIRHAVAGVTITVREIVGGGMVLPSEDNTGDTWACLAVMIDRADLWRFAGRITSVTPQYRAGDRFRVTLPAPDPKAQEELDSLYLHATPPLSERKAPPPLPAFFASFRELQP